MRWTPVIAVTVLAILAGCSGLGGSAGPGAQTPVDIAENPPDPEEDVLGWEQGYWYNESIAVTQADGLSESEREALVARTMARVERVRQLEFQSEVPVRVIERERFASLSRSENVSRARRAFVNAKFEALFMVNESVNAVAVRQNGTATAVSGFYSSQRGQIVLVASGGGVQVDETTLAHELTHALQDQHFDISEFERPTREQHNAVDGLVEGDANLVQFLYQQRCANAWNGTCATPPTEPTEGGSGSIANVGPFLLRYQPYSDGPPFLEQLRSGDSWDRVDALYEDPPASTEQTIHPERYGEDRPANVSIADRSSDAWTRLTVPDRPNYAEVGEAGLASMLVRPALETQGRVEVVNASSFLTGDEGLDPYNYSTRYTAGWDGDRLAVYVSPRAEAGEYGYVYKTVWDSPAQAREFAEGYRQLLRIEGARPVEGPSNTWHIPEGTGFGDAYYVRIEGDTVTIVNAPTVDALSGVYGDAAPRSGG